MQKELEVSEQLPADAHHKQQVTDEVRRWIVVQAQSGHAAQAMLQAMKADGWDEKAAVDVIDATLSAYLAEHARQHGLPPPTIVPEPDLRESPTTLVAGDREVNVMMVMRHPMIVVFGGLLTSDECDELVTLATPRLKRSTVVDDGTGTGEISTVRTSQGMFFQRTENPLCARIERRIAALLNWPVENGEGLQVLRYGPGTEYRPHHDYFDPTKPGTPTHLKRGGQRVGTLLMYLNTPSKGGGTTFPHARMEVAPIKGHAVFFSYERPHPVTRTLHGAAPVIEGEKWVATKWLRERPFK